MDRNSDCKAGVCVENRADKGQACRDQVVYSGECWEQESEEPCSRQPGTRLAPDLFGGVECKCAFHLGHTLQDGVCQKWGPSLLDIRGLNFLEKEIWRRCPLSADYEVLTLQNCLQVCRVEIQLLAIPARGPVPVGRARHPGLLREVHHFL